MERSKIEKFTRLELEMIGAIKALIEGARIADCGCIWHSEKGNCTHDRLNQAVEFSKTLLGIIGGD